MLSAAHGEPLLLDDFEGTSGTSTIGTEWEGFTDRVMGGVSRMQAGYVRHDAGTALRMTGRVSLENNGGFIQVRLPVAAGSRFFDAREYTGIALTVRGAPGSYAVHVRTSRTRLPWAYYKHELPVDQEWRRVEIPFSEFDGQSMLAGGRPNVDRLASIAVVAGEAEFDADISIDRIELYR